MNVDLSYWEKKHFWNNCDIAIIGSGIMGLTASIFIKRLNPSARVVIIERGALPAGASTRNAGFACFGSAGEILDDLKSQSEAAVFNLVKRRFAGLAALRHLLGDTLIDYKQCGGFEIFTDDEMEHYEHVLGSLSYLNAEMVQAIGRQCFWDESSRVKDFGLSGITSMVVNREEGIIDTGLMMRSLLQKARVEGVEIYNGVEVLSVDPAGYISTSLGELKAGFTVVATNGLAKQLLPDLDVKPCRGQVLITKPIPGLNFEACFHHDRGYNYFRTVDGRILLGGGRQTNPSAEETDEMKTTVEIQEYLDKLLANYILKGQSYEIDMRWSGIMGMGDSKQVIVEQLSPKLGVAVRFGGMGVALGTQIGKEVAEWTR